MTTFYGTLTSSPDFSAVYKTLLWRLLSGHAVTEHNERTGVNILASLCPVHFNIDLSNGFLPVCGIRKTYPRTAAAEVAWFVLGSKDISFIREYAPIWDKFVEEDGVTVAGAYGHRWREQFGRDQLAKAIEALKANPSDRRVVVMAWDASQDGLGNPSKNVPCPIGYTLSIVNGRLNSAIILRSSDVFVGLPYDVMGHALLMQAIATSLGVKLGVMSVTLAHPHLYEVHEAMALEALQSETVVGCIAMPTWSIEDIEEDPHGYVLDVKEMIQDKLPQPPYFCRPEVVV